MCVFQTQQEQLADQQDIYVNGTQKLETLYRSEIREVLLYTKINPRQLADINVKMHKTFGRYLKYDCRSGKDSQKQKYMPQFTIQSYNLMLLRSTRRKVKTKSINQKAIGICKINRELVQGKNDTYELIGKDKSIERYEKLY